MEFIKNGLMSEGKFYSLDFITNEIHKVQTKELNLVVMTLERKSVNEFCGIKESIVTFKPSEEEFISKIDEVEITFGDICVILNKEDITISYNAVEFLRDYPSGMNFNYSFTEQLHKVGKYNEVLDNLFSFINGKY